MGTRHGPHDHGDASVFEVGTREGIRALRIGVIGLGLTAIVQFSVVAIGGSVGLFADALHNLGDVLTTIVLWIAFVAGRRAADDRYTFGYQRFEDLAGLVIVAAIVVSGGLAVYEGAKRLVDPQIPTHLWLGVGAAAVGVVGNEAVAQVKIRTGRRIRSPALVAEGQHSRVDALASLAVVVGFGGIALGFLWADPVVALGIGGLILSIAWRTGRPVVARLADRIDPAIIERIAQTAVEVKEVRGVHAIRARWAGRALYVALHIDLPADSSLERAHAIGEEVRHRILHGLPQVAQIDLHIDPVGGSENDPHSRTRHHGDQL